ncbi:MAG: hypothetical protein ACYTGH_07640 [Planctomycetota bacterium]|jgi:hypothetical protein
MSDSCGCSGGFEDGRQVVDKVRSMGFSANPLPAPLEISCSHCQETFTMKTIEAKCPSCETVYAVTPCHAHSADNVMAAGIGY